ncbi:MAG: glucose-6-phosphate dehydrogenase, partial [Boseongicola sp.]
MVGATGDLARRKLIPALYARYRARQIPDGSRIIGTARTQQTQDEFRSRVNEWLIEFAPNQDAETVRKFLSTLDYISADATSDAGWKAVASRLGAANERVRAFYLSVAPRFFAPTAERIVNAEAGGEGCRIVVEKPLGHDLASARKLNAQLSRHFDEEQI